MWGGGLWCAARRQSGQRGCWDLWWDMWEVRSVMLTHEVQSLVDFQMCSSQRIPLLLTCTVCA